MLVHTRLGTASYLNESTDVFAKVVSLQTSAFSCKKADLFTNAIGFERVSD